MSAAAGKIGAIVGMFGFMYAAQKADGSEAAETGYPSGIGVRLTVGPTEIEARIHIPYWSWDVILDLYFLEVDLQMSFGGFNLEVLAGVALSSP
jgi:hypothetical protein